MSAGPRFPVYGYTRSAAMPPGVKWLLIINSVLFVVYFFAYQTGYASPFFYFGLIPRAVTELFAFWQLVTYMFLHDPRNIFHILFNMLTLWMFGRELESTWGTRRFLKYYFLCGVGAGVCVILAAAAFGSMETRTIGASGAIYGLLLAFGVLFPDVPILFMFFFPMKAKYAVMLYGAIAFFGSFGSTGDGVSHIAHLGGMLLGFVYLRSRRFRKAQTDFLTALEHRYKDWKLRRAKRKFQVYLKKHGSRRDLQ